MIIELTQRGFEKLSPTQRSMVSAFCALFGYGGWAYLVNSMHGMPAAIKAACVQGGYSFALTFVVTLLIEVLYQTLQSLFSNVRLIEFFTIFLACLALFSTSWWINAMAGTPEILSTVLLGYVIGGVYTFSYVKSLGKSSGKQLLKN